MNPGEEEMLQLMGTDDSFRSIASWLSDNIVTMQEKMYGFFDMSCTLQLEGMAVICLCSCTSKSVHMNATVKTIPLKTSCDVLRTMEFLRMYTCRENLLHDVAVRGNLQPWTDQSSCDLPT